MAGPSRLEIVDRTLMYLKTNDVEKAIKYLEETKDEILRERENKPRRQRKDIVARCLEEMEKNPELMDKVKEKFKEKISA
mgnify:CR=1 FL=1